MKVIKQMILGVCAILVLAPSIAFADLPNHETVVEPSASAGTLIAAVLESAGYKALAIVLEDLNTTFAALGSLILITVMAIGIYQLAVGDKLKHAAWLLIGPPTFYFLINSQVQAKGATWQFGTYDGSEQVEVVLGDGTQSASTVPWLFHRYNVLLSSVIQELVKVITSYDESDQQRFMARPHLSDYIANAKVGSPELASMIQFSLASCGSGLEKAAGLIGATRQKNGVVELVDATSSQRTNLSLAQQSLDSKSITVGVGAWRDGFESTMNRAVTDKQDTARWQQLKPYHACLDQYVFAAGSSPAEVFSSSSVVSCNMLWCTTAVAAQYEAETILQRAKDATIPPDASEQLVTQIVNDVRRKLLSDAENTNVSLPESLAQIQYVVGGMLIRDFLQTKDHSNFMGSLAERWRYRTVDTENRSRFSRESQINLATEYKMEQLSDRERIQMYVFTQLLPYMQGIVLYVLAISYPFCALFVLIPDKATNFLIWFAAWTWAKSWDLGWAVVMVIENLLWEFMPLNTPHELADNYDVITMLDQAYTSNHSNSLATYYVIVSMLLSAVPLLTAKVLLGSHAAMGQHLVNGLQKVTNSMGEKVSRRRAIGQLHTITAQKSQGIREFQARGMGAAILGSFENGVLRDGNGNVIPADSDLGQALTRLYSDTKFQEARSNIEKSMSIASSGSKAAEWGMGAAMLGAMAKGHGTQRLVQSFAAGATAVPALNSTANAYRDLGRAAVNAQFKLLESVGNFMAYEYARTQEFRYYESERAAISDRGEPFAYPEEPVSALVEIDNIANSSASTLLGAWGTTVGSGAGLMFSTANVVKGE